MAPKCSILIDLGSFLEYNFPSNFATPLKLQQSIMRKTISYQFRPPILASKINQNIIFAQTPSWTSLLSFCIDFLQKGSLWGPLQNPVGAKMPPEIDQVAPKVSKTQMVHPSVTVSENAKTWGNAKQIGRSLF